MRTNPGIKFPRFKSQHPLAVPGIQAAFMDADKMGIIIVPLTERFKQINIQGAEV